MCVSLDVRVEDQLVLRFRRGPSLLFLLSRRSMSCSGGI